MVPMVQQKFPCHFLTMLRILYGRFSRETAGSGVDQMLRVSFLQMQVLRLNLECRLFIRSRCLWRQGEEAELGSWENADGRCQGPRPAKKASANPASSGQSTYPMLGQKDLCAPAWLSSGQGMTQGSGTPCTWTNCEGSTANLDRKSGSGAARLPRVTDKGAGTESVNPSPSLIDSLLADVHMQLSCRSTHFCWSLYLLSPALVSSTATKNRAVLPSTISSPALPLAKLALLPAAMLVCITKLNIKW